MERARQGFLELEKFVRSARSGNRPVDGYYVQFWRLLLRYPELAAWEMLWTDSLRETYAAIYKTVKTAKPNVPVGWHIWHNNSFNPIYRAEQDLHELSNYSDFIKVVMYNNVRWRAHGAVCRQYWFHALWRFVQTGPDRF